MPLTPVDIHNIAFNKTAIGRRGYDEEQVDAFLDELVLDLTGLIEENNQLRAEFERGGAAGGPAGSGVAAEVDHVRTQLDQAQREKAAAEQAVRRMRAELEQPRTGNGPMTGDDSEQQATPVLMMAQRTADGHIADARREANELMSTARREAERLSEQARSNADALERDARQRHQDALAALDAQRTAALTHIEELIRFQREYRAGLKAHVEGQLRDVGGRGPGPDAASAAETAGRTDR